MTHPRKEIRDAVVALLSGQVSEVGARVVSNSVFRYKPDALPAINVVTGDEKAEIYAQASRMMKRTVKLAIEIVVKDSDPESIDDVADSIAAQVEEILAGDETLGDSASDSFLSETPGIQVRREGALPLAALQVVYDVVYYTVHSSAAPDTFETGTYILGPSGATDTTPKMSGTIEPDQ